MAKGGLSSSNVAFSFDNGAAPDRNILGVDNGDVGIVEDLGLGSSSSWVQFSVGIDEKL